MSERDAREWVRDSQQYTVGAHDDLMIDARKGIAEQRAVVTQISRKLGLDFKEHILELPMDGSPAVKVTMYARSLTGVARWLARLVDSHHCIPRVQRDGNGDRYYSHPMWSDWALAQYGTPLQMGRDRIASARNALG